MAPAFGILYLVGLINMLKGMDLGSSSSTSAPMDGLITTLYGCILAHMVFGPIATLLWYRDEEEVRAR